uniref:Uncharacterized protein n=1 Tax=Anguilla anguilla TaxID=7936 RepID=A0A0E9UN98_ANGAN
MGQKSLLQVNGSECFLQIECVSSDSFHQCFCMNLHFTV